MNVYDKAYELKHILEECDEVKEYRSAYEKVKSSPNNMNMLEDFRKKQIEIQAMQLSGQKPDNSKIEQIEKLYNVISLNPDINKFLQCEYKFSMMMNDISNIISEAVGIEPEKTNQV